MKENLPRVWVTGAGGLIGHHLVLAARKFAPWFQVVPLTHGELELTDFAAVEKRFLVERPQWVIHCAAVSRAADCQADPAAARRVNVDAAVYLAALAAESGFIFFSSDLVFDGKKGGYVESDPPNPLNFYGETKAVAEEIILRNPRHIVLRVGLNSGASLSGRRSFNEEMANVWRAGGSVKLFSDEFRCPLPAAVTARAVWELARPERAGLYHLAGSERLSRVEIGRVVAARHPELEARIEVCSQKEYRGPARPADVSLNCGKTQAVLSFALPAFSSVAEL
ncbi:MAG TPA: NAD(P)-dependent oxidoreductase [Candidatus Acidoferrum sp.]|nr:NAD(P)-dependent oxidoreductase [Candidatus Acidoferrum sp.]